MYNFGTLTRLRPQSLLRHLSSSYDTTCFQAFSNLVTWSIYLQEGKIIYATHSVAPFDRLERHLHRLSDQIPGVTSETCVQLRLMFDAESHGNVNKQPADYQALKWLISEGYLNSAQATLLVQELVKEVVESLLLIKAGNFALSDSQIEVSAICKLDVEKVINFCQIQLRNWLSFTPYISSPYQRPYLLTTSMVHNPDIQPHLSNWMKGFSLRHLAVMMNQNEMELAKTLYADIIKGGVILHEPDPPYDQLPRNLEDLSLYSTYTIESLRTNLVDIPVETIQNNSQVADDIPVEQFPDSSTFVSEHIPELTILNNTNRSRERVTTATITTQKVYKIVAVDDSPTILKEIDRFLESESCVVVIINDPIKAVMSIIRHKPDVILLDLNMPGIDGYELCRVIRNNANFKDTPIIFVTGFQGIVDQVKARLVGASGYLKKPFTELELHKIIFQHLT
ncbi:response regulator [Nodularia harveyana UHCC-0300]|uniref:Protein PatA n=1 Tax=Nodularia harveyana UHCC-0300 TaxID=2974287 RepID=A0ABU5UFQ8_9CYAN|nr:response regulator [Nodularia harveyana]MEA5582397.1 response regulator [Nodularia harveyana UHCC-0300]